MLVWKNVFPDRMVFRMRSCSASDMLAGKVNVNKPEAVVTGGVGVVLGAGVGAVGLLLSEPPHDDANIPITHSTARIRIAKQ